MFLSYMMHTDIFSGTQSNASYSLKLKRTDINAFLKKQLQICVWIQLHAGWKSCHCIYLISSVSVASDQLNVLQHRKWYLLESSISFPVSHLIIQRENDAWLTWPLIYSHKKFKLSISTYWSHCKCVCDVFKDTATLHFVLFFNIVYKTFFSDGECFQCKLMEIINCIWYLWYIVPLLIKLSN